MDFPTVRELARRKNAVRILKFLMKCSEEPSVMDIYNTLDMYDGTGHYWLTKLTDLGVIKVVRTPANLGAKYFRITDREDAQRIIDRFHWNVGFKLARLVPYAKTEESKVREDKRFIALCEEYHLTINEGIEAVKKCSKIEVERVGHPYNKTYLLRKEQGYDADILEEARKAIG